VRHRRTTVATARSAYAPPPAVGRQVSHRPQTALRLDTPGLARAIWGRVLVLHERRVLQPHDSVAVGADKVRRQQSPTRGIAHHCQPVPFRDRLSVTPIGAGGLGGQPPRSTQPETDFVHVWPSVGRRANMERRHARAAFDGGSGGQASPKASPHPCHTPSGR